MKLPLIAVVTGLLLGILAVVWLSPQTPEGAALILFIAVLLTTLFGLIGAKIVGLITHRRSP
jgi:uncharacterized membrane protein YgaE (UPF0421/DUF939 family)